MSYPFENNPKFQSLSEEAKNIVRQKFDGMSNEAKQIVAQKLATPEPSMLDKAKVAYQQYKASPLHQASPIGMLETANDWIHKGANMAGEKTAEAIATEFPNMPPQIPAAVGTTIQMAPDIASSFVGGGAAQGSAKAGNLGMAGRVVSGPSRKAAGKAIGLAEEAAGVHPDIIPTLKDVSANLGLKNASTKQYLNALMERLKSGETLSPQALSQHHKMVTDILSKEPKGFAKAIGMGESKLGNSGVAQASKIDEMLVQQLNQAAPGRADAAANYAAAKTRAKIYKGAGAVGLATVGGNKLTDMLNKAWGR